MSQKKGTFEYHKGKDKPWLIPTIVGRGSDNRSVNHSARACRVQCLLGQVSPRDSLEVAELVFVQFFLFGGFDLLHYPVKVTFKQTILYDTVLLEFAFGMSFGKLRAYLATVLQNVTFSEL